jgi:hypothetical protein
LKHKNTLKNLENRKEHLQEKLIIETLATYFHFRFRAIKIKSEIILILLTSTLQLSSWEMQLSMARLCAVIFSLGKFEISAQWPF